MSPRLASSLRLLSFALCTGVLWTFLVLFGRNNDLTTAGQVMIIVVSLIGFGALFALFYTNSLHILVRFAGVGLAGGVAALFAFGAFGPLVQTDYIALANAEAAYTDGRYTTSTVVEDCTTNGSRPKGFELRTDGFVCVVTVDSEHNAVVAYLRDGLSLNNTDPTRSADMRTLTLTFPAEGRADIYLFDVTSGLPGQNLPQEVVDAEGRGHHLDVPASRYFIASTNN